MDRFVIVTGAAGGLGGRTASALARRGYTVFACDIRTAAEEQGIIPVTLDVTDQKSVEECFKTVRSYTDSLYALINLAGIFMMDTVANGAEEALLRSMEVNFRGAYRMNRAFLPLIEKGRGRIINMSSELGGYSPQPFNGCYCISKHALDCYTDTLARELAFVGIPVIKIRAGSFQTGMLGCAEQRFKYVAENNTLLGSSVGVFSGLVGSEIQKTNDPELFVRLVIRILEVKRPKRRYRIKNSFKLRLLNALPEYMQDGVYLLAVKIGKRAAKKNNIA